MRLKVFYLTLVFAYCTLKVVSYSFKNVVEKRLPKKKSFVPKSLSTCVRGAGAEPVPQLAALVCRYRSC
jgi:hypothetical protein